MGKKEEPKSVKIERDGMICTAILLGCKNIPEVDRPRCDHLISLLNAEQKDLLTQCTLAALSQRSGVLVPDLPATILELDEAGIFGEFLERYAQPVQ